MPVLTSKTVFHVTDFKNSIEQCPLKTRKIAQHNSAVFRRTEIILGTSELQAPDLKHGVTSVFTYLGKVYTAASLGTRYRAVSPSCSHPGTAHAASRTSAACSLANVPTSFAT